MSLLFIDGFDHYATNDVSKKWDSCYAGSWGNYVIECVSPRRVGVSYLKGSVSDSYWIQKNFESSEDTVVIGFAFRPDTTLASSRGWQIGNASGHQVTIKVEIDGSITVRRGNWIGTILGQSVAGVINSGTWQYIEFKIKVHNSAGTYEVRANEQNVISGSGVDTQYQATGGVSYLRVYGMDVTYTFYGDLYIVDTAGSKNNDFLGDCRVDCLMPSGVGNYAQWTPSVGANHECVDDPGDIDDDATYIESGTVDHKDSYAYGDLAALGKTIHGVAASVCLRKTDAGTIKAKPLARIGASDYLGDEKEAVDNYKVKQHVWEDNPDDSAAWEEADVNGAEFGMQLTTVISTTTTTTSSSSTTTTTA